jgi:hypothetical protein
VSLYAEVYDAILAGRPNVEVHGGLERLSRAQRQQILCTVCSIQPEMAQISRTHGISAADLLMVECPLFATGSDSCPIKISC